MSNIKNKLGKGFKALLIISIIFLVLFIAAFVVFGLFANKMNDAELGSFVDVLEYFGLRIVDLFLFKFKFVSDAVYFALSCLLYVIIVIWLTFLIVGIVVSIQRKRKVMVAGIILTFVNIAVYLIVVTGLFKYAHVFNNLKDIPLLVMIPTFGIIGFGGLYFLFAIFTYFAALVETFKYAEKEEISEPIKKAEIVEEEPQENSYFERIRRAIRSELQNNQPFKIYVINKQMLALQNGVAPVVTEEPVKEAEPEPEPVVVMEEPKQEEIVDIPLRVEAPVKEAPIEEVSQETTEEEADWNRSVRQPFINRIITADADIKANYNEIKNEILSYGVKARLSRGGETFRLHEKRYVKIYLVGKTLKVYFALSPEDYKDSTIPVEDVGHRPNYADMPLLFKVRSGLSVRRCKELVKAACEKDGLQQGEVQDVNWINDLRKINAEKAKNK